MAAEFTSRLTADFVRPGLPAIALTTDTSFLTAYANDFDFDGIFARQVQALGKPGDLLDVQVRPLWGPHYRVNVFVGANITCARIIHSFFLVTDGNGNVLESTPKIKRQY